MRIFEYSDFQFETLPTYAKVDCMFEAAQFALSAAEHLLDGCEVWTDDLQEAQTILQNAARLCRIKAIKLEKLNNGSRKAAPAPTGEQALGAIDPTMAARHYMDKSDDPGHGPNSDCEMCQFHLHN